MPKAKINIDHTQFENLCKIQCTKREIASVFSCSEETIERFCKREYSKTFQEAWNIYSAGGRASLRRIQFKLAEKNAGMAIFLGKNYLGQRDSFEDEDKTTMEKLDSILSQLRERAGKKDADSE